MNYVSTWTEACPHELDSVSTTQWVCPVCGASVPNSTCVRCNSSFATMSHRGEE